MKTNLELYKVFYQTASLKSVTAAASKLYITQPAVSQAIRNLEEQLQTSLFSRKPRGMELTKAGGILFEYIQQAYTLMEKGERSLVELRNLEAGEFIISAGDTICRHILLPVIERFHKAFPAIQVKITNRTTAETAALLKSGEADLGLLALPFNDDSLEVHPVYTVHDCFLCGKKFKKELPGRPALKDLEKYPMLLLESGTITRKVQETQFARRGVQLNPEIELGSLDLLVEFAKINMGIACVPREFFYKQIDNINIFEIPIKKELAPRKFAAAWKRNIPLSSASAAFFQFIKEQFSKFQNS